MEDKEIIELFNLRDEKAILAASEKYKAYCSSIAFNVLKDAEDAQECFNDALLRAWNSIPPEEPLSLKAYIGRITRNLSLDRYDRETAQKRGGGQPELALDELSEVVPSSSKVEDHLEGTFTAAVINSFLSELDPEKRQIFMRRYYYFDSVKAIARYYGYSEAKIKTMLFRVRAELKKKLEEEGINI